MKIPNIPNSFSERILFGLMIIGGFFGVGACAILFVGAGDNAKLQLTRDVLLTIGPLLGVIVNSIWRTDKVDKINADTASTLANKQPDLSAIPLAPVAPADGQV